MKMFLIKWSQIWFWIYDKHFTELIRKKNYIYLLFIYKAYVYFSPYFSTF